MNRNTSGKESTGVTEVLVWTFRMSAWWFTQGQSHDYGKQQSRQSDDKEGCAPTKVLIDPATY
jgi:hypothetical protein